MSIAPRYGPVTILKLGIYPNLPYVKVQGVVPSSSGSIVPIADMKQESGMGKLL